jgi:hypothetical protein
VITARRWPKHFKPLAYAHQVTIRKQKISVAYVHVQDNILSYSNKTH